MKGDDLGMILDFGDLKKFVSNGEKEKALEEIGSMYEGTETAGQDEMLEKLERLIKKCNLDFSDKSFVLCYVINNEAQHERKNQNHQQHSGLCRRVKDEHLYHCPFCKHHKKKMSVNFAKNYFKCWVCDARGKNIYRIVRRFGTYDQRQKWLQLDGRLDLSEFDKFFAEINEKEIKQTISSR